MNYAMDFVDFKSLIDAGLIWAKANRVRIINRNSGTHIAGAEDNHGCPLSAAYWAAGGTASAPGISQFAIHFGLAGGALKGLAGEKTQKERDNTMREVRRFLLAFDGIAVRTGSDFAILGDEYRKNLGL